MLPFIWYLITEFLYILDVDVVWIYPKNHDVQHLENPGKTMFKSAKHWSSKNSHCRLITVIKIAINGRISVM